MTTACLSEPRDAADKSTKARLMRALITDSDSMTLPSPKFPEGLPESSAVPQRCCVGENEHLPRGSSLLWANRCSRARDVALQGQHQALSLDVPQAIKSQCPPALRKSLWAQRLPHCQAAWQGSNGKTRRGSVVGAGAVQKCSSSQAARKSSMHGTPCHKQSLPAFGLELVALHPIRPQQRAQNLIALLAKTYR